MIGDGLSNSAKVPDVSAKQGKRLELRAPNQAPVQTERVIRWIFTAILVGCVFSLAFSAQTSSAAEFWPVLAVALAISGASLFAGGLLGFIFGLPRSLQSDGANTSSQSAEGTNQVGKAVRSYVSNTNLEQISDWLTKILVGVGLTQLMAVPSLVRSFMSFVSPGLGGYSDSGVFAILISLYYAASGFLLVYLWTRRYVAFEFHQGDLEDRVRNLENQKHTDGLAWELVQRQLHPDVDAEPVNEQDLADVIKGASPITRNQIFKQIQDIVADFWGKSANLNQVSRTVPILKALAQNDTDDQNDEYHGYLGVGLAVQVPADWAGSLRELNATIDSGGYAADFAVYRYYRALSMIGLDKNFAANQPSDPPVAKTIYDDLKLVVRDATWAPFVPDNETLKKWAETNKMSLPTTAGT